ncbi:MAG TPA: DUF4012 domain-containing protein [Caldilineaceae bacterium]|nr:DUF4012 domain-containing protein [Caldilineaceae bacterium]
MKLTNPLSNRSAIERPSDRSPARRQWLFLARVIVAVVLVVLAYKVVRAALFGLAAYNEGMGLLALRRDGDLGSEDLIQAQESMAEIYRSVAAMEQEMRFFAPALRATRLLPGIGATLAATPDLLLAGREMVAIANDTVRLAAPEAQQRPDAPMPEVALAAMATHPDHFLYLAERAAAAQAALEAIPADRLIGPLVEPVSQAQEAVALLADGLGLAPVLPRLLGLYGAQTYLLLIQNNQELRGSGGFISGVGRLVVNKGRFEQIEFADSYSVARHDVDHPRAPLPQQRYMGIELVYLRDVNWSPDFPTTAALARSLYAQDAGIPVDGVVSVDLRTVQLLVGALEPLEVEGAEAPITDENLIEQLQRFWDQPPTTDATIQTDGAEWWRQRKDFMPILAQAALARLESGRFNPLALAHAVNTALAERSVQVWMVDQAAAKALAELGWDGALKPEPGADYVALVDSNMGYNKVDAVLERSMRYQVTWPDGPDAPALATLAVTYRHPLKVEGHVCDPSSNYGLVYTDMIERCYFDYVRLYTPLGSELVSIEGVEPDSVTVQLGERGTQVFAGYFSVETGSSHTVTFSYQLPPQITPDQYRLVVQRQAGAAPIPLEATAGEESIATTLQEARLVWSPREQ